MAPAATCVVTRGRHLPLPPAVPNRCAANANELKRIYSQLGARLTAGRGRTTEISALFAAAGAALAMISVLYSLLRFNRVF